jgi:5S rRNA maturation endonuclease (ribonuclease M5)
VIDFYCDFMGLNRRRDAYRAVMEMKELFGGINAEPLQLEITKEKMDEVLPLSNPRKNIHLTLEPVPIEIAEEKGIIPETWAYFGAGMATHGNLKGHIAIPMHDKNGNRIGYAGQGQKDGNWRFYFSKSVELYNLHRIWKGRKLGFVVLVEGFFSAMYLHQSGVCNVVAGMGVTLSATQLEMLQEASDKIIILYDNDKAGRKGIEKALQKLPLAKAVGYPKGMKEAKPKDIEAETLRQCIGNALRLFS